MSRKTSRFLILPALAAAAALAVAAGGAEPAKWHVVGGLRHGASFFAKVDYPWTKPRAEGVLDFAHYHTYGEVLAFLEKWAKDYPELVDLYSVGRSFEGREIRQLTITNKATGKDTDKPAMFIEGNRHSGEVTAAESALWFVHHVLTNYGRDPEITRLVDGAALYVRVKNNPDGSELYLQTAQSNRSTVRPYDDDRDGLLDEDPGEDLDGDGLIFQMRRKVEAGQGEFVLDPADPTARLLKRVGAGKGDYRVFSEGVDNDSDGRFNEDGIGGLDLHRNYPENWRPLPGRDLSGRGWTQSGAGEYPLSEPETRAVFQFLLEHPNVGVVQTMDTSVPMLLHGPSTSRMDESMFPEDAKLYRFFDAEGKKITGYAAAGDTYWDYANLGRAERAALRGPEGGEDDREMRGSPLFGHSPDFGYLYYGAVWYGDELWNGGRVRDYDGDGRFSEVESLRYVDEELGGRYFKAWTKFAHPTLGEVEIGSFNPKFWRQNPPVELLEEWIRKEALFNLFLARSLPRVKVLSAESRPVKKGPGAFEIVAVVANEGVLPTALKMAERVKIVRPDAVEVKLPAGFELAEGRARRDIGILQPNEKREVRWRVKAAAGAEPPAGRPGEAEITLLSTRGGVARARVKIG